MPMWRCPHCATPQAETARCWVCHRSSTACGSCRHFRRSVAAQLGYCGLDRQRRPLRGDEIRSCWEAADATRIAVTALPGVGPVWPLEGDGDRTSVPSRQFVEVRSNPAAGDDRSEFGDAAAAETSRDPLFLTGIPGDEPRWSLWGEPEA